MLFTVVAGDAAAADVAAAAATATFIAQALALLFVFIKSTKQLQFNIKNNNKQQPESCGKASCSMLQYAAAAATAAAAVAAHSHCSYCILAVNYLPLCLAQRGRGRIEKSEDSRQENVGESRRMWSDQLLLLLPACSSIENVLLHASTVNACQFLLLLLLLLLALHLRLILQQLPTSCGICANVNKLINCLYSAVDVDDFYSCIRCI